MTLKEMIERLTEAAEVYGDDAEVRLMTQYNWPFEYTVDGVTSSEEIREAKADDDFDPEGDTPVVVYILEGQQLGYGTKAAWDICQ